MKLDVGRRAKGAVRTVWNLVNRALADHVLQLAAALTYYTVLSLFPALFIIVALLGVIGLSPETLANLLDEVAARTGSEWAVDIVSGVLDSILAARGTTIYLGAGILVSLWSASGYVYAFMWASDAIYKPPAQRSYWKTMPLRVALALLLILLFTTAVAMVTILGPLGDRIAAGLHIQDSMAFEWSQAATPLLGLAALIMLVLLYKFTPSRRQPKLWRLMGGALFTLVAWAVVSFVFSFYLANFASYNQVYGTLGAAVGFLIWVWMMNASALAGMEINRAIEFRTRGGAAEAVAGESGAAEAGAAGEAEGAAEAGAVAGEPQATAPDDEDGPGRLKRLEQRVVVDLAARLDARVASYPPEAGSPDRPAGSADEAGDEAGDRQL